MALIPLGSALVWPPPPQPIRSATDVAMTVNCAIFLMRSLVEIDGNDDASPHMLKNGRTPLDVARLMLALKHH